MSGRVAEERRSAWLVSVLVVAVGSTWAPPRAAAQDAPWSPPRQLSHGATPARILFNFGRAIGIDAAGVIHVAWVRPAPSLSKRRPRAGRAG